MKDAIKYAVALLLFILAAYGLSWLAVFSYWFAAFAFHSVTAVRFCEAVSSVVLIPVRLVFWIFRRILDPIAPLTDPTSYAGMNAVLLGTLVYAWCRRFLFGGSPPTAENRA